MITNSPYQKTTASPRNIIQPKLMVNAPNDVYEQEADAVADRVMRMPLVSSKAQGTQGMLASSVQRKCAHCEEEKKKMPIMRKAESSGGFETSPAFSSQLSNTKGGGQAMPSETKGFMESRFGRDFSNVRVHTDGQAATMNRDIQAKAFTHGSDIYFNRGEFAPNTEGGRRLLAHELVHTVQQTGAKSQNEKQPVIQPSSVRIAKQAAPVACPHPINFSHVNPVNHGANAIRVSITWDSSTGNLADLSNCEVREVVTYDPIPNPPFLFSPPNPTVLGGSATSGAGMDTHSYPDLKTNISDPRASGRMVSHQVYQWKCTGEGCTNTWTDFAGEQYTITRAISPQFVRFNPWRFRITKTGNSNLFNFSREVEVPVP